MSDDLQHLLARNRAWADAITANDPEFFSRLSLEQKPEYLWIGCSDSRVSASQVIDVLPGEVFVHRNIANVVVHTDFSCLAVLQFSVEVLKVRHIIVCGHYGCGGVKASLEDAPHGLIDNWLGHLRDVRRFNRAELDGLSDGERLNRLCELNVIEQVKNVGTTTVVQNAWQQGQNLSIHGLIYDIRTGLLRDLETRVDSDRDLRERFPEL